MIKFSPYMSRDKGNDIYRPEEGVCIVLVCHEKGYIPVGGNEFPESIEGIPTDVREGSVSLAANANPPRAQHVNSVDDYNDPLKMGCSISRKDIDNTFGTLGCFVQNDEGREGFLTCCHVMINGPHLPESGEEIVQPSIRDCRDRSERGESDPRQRLHHTCGILIHSFFGNQLVDDVDYAMDEAFVEMTHRVPLMNLTFAGLTSSIFEELFRYRDLTRRDMHMNGGRDCDVQELSHLKDTLVFKCGAHTKMTVGDIELCEPDGGFRHVKMSSHQLKGDFGHTFIGKNLIFAQNVENENPFIEKGDSGAMVFHIRRNNELEAVGLAVGFIDGSDFSEYLIMPLRPILRHYNWTLLSRGDQ